MCCLVWCGVMQYGVVFNLARHALLSYHPVYLCHSLFLHEHNIRYNGIICCNQGLMCPSTDYRRPLPMCDAEAADVARESHSRTATMYAESTDGRNWTQPQLGQVPWPFFNSSKANNIAFSSGDADPNRGVLLDRQETNASRRFKAFGRYVGERG